MKPVSRGRLGYPFTPVPRWLRRDRSSNLLSAETYDLLAFLYDRADTDALRAQGQTPRLTVATIAEGIGWRYEEASLARRLDRLRAEGRYLTYEAVGNSRTRYTYVFQLFTADPSVSDLRPPVTVDEDRVAGDLRDAPCPAVAGSRLSVDDAKIAMVEPFSEDADDSSVRALQTFSETPTTRSEENLLGRESDANQDHTVGTTTESGGPVGARELVASTEKLIAMIESAAPQKNRPEIASLPREDSCGIETSSDMGTEPLPGDDGFRDFLNAAHLAGHITGPERHQRRITHDLIRRAQHARVPPDERDLIAALLTSFDGAFIEEHPPSENAPTRRQDPVRDLAPECLSSGGEVE